MDCPQVIRVDEESVPLLDFEARQFGGGTTA